MTPDDHPIQGFTIITGLSGAGRSEVAHSLEDLGFFVVDNLPPALLPKMAELTMRPGLADAGSRSWSTPAAASSSASSRRRSRSSASTIATPGSCSSRHPTRTSCAGTRRPAAGTRWRPPDRVVEGIRKERADPRAAARRGGPGDRHVRADAPRAPRPGAGRVRRHAARGRAPGLGRSPSASSTGRRGTPTSCSTSGSCRTRTGSPSCGRTRAPIPTVRDYVRSSELYATYLERLEALLDASLPGLRRRGEELPDDRDRLHRRAPPLRRRGRGAGRAGSAIAACRSSLVAPRPRARLTTGSGRRPAR